MKKIVLFLMISFIALFSGCNDLEDIVFDHEKQQFPTKENAILLEIILPTGSLVDDEYYIIGDFNGGEDAIGDPEWRLEKAPQGNSKWGIYLMPSSFQNGKTLTDGFTFYSKRQGGERSVKDEPVIHTLDVQLGSFTNVWVNRWESYFGEVEKNSYSIYVNNQTGWDEITLYSWGDVELGGGWPGMLPTGTEEINGVIYTVFDLGEETKDLTVNLIFNNNNQGKQFDALQDFTINRDVYLIITDGSFEEVDPNVSPYLGYTIYVEDNSGWDEIALYGWGDIELGGGWPGLQPTGTKELNGVIYTYFELGEDTNDKNINLIFNNNDGGEQFDAMQEFIVNRDVYLKITKDSFEEINPNETPYSGYTVYVEDNTGWDELTLYAYGDAEPAGWPGLQPTGTKDVNGVTYTYFEIGEEVSEKTLNIIFNNNGKDLQLEDIQIVLNKDFYFLISESGVVEINPEDEEGFTIFVLDNSGWESTTLHYWGEEDVTGTNWPGTKPTGTKQINDETYSYFELPSRLNNKSINTIFNNNGAGEQFDGPYIKLDKDHYFKINNDSYIVIED